MNELLGLAFSPWTEKARWALDVRGVPYRYRRYEPVLGEPALRVKTKRWRGTVTVPVLTAVDGTVYDDSAAIARFADAHATTGPTLFPPAHDTAIAEWIEASERGLDAGRALALPRTLDSRPALLEYLPRGLRRIPGAVGIARFGVRRTLRKYRSRGASLTTYRGTLDAELTALRRALARAPGSAGAAAPKTLLGTFTFADIAAAQLLGFVSPPTFGLKIGDANRAAFVDPELATAYADLLAWRDALYDAYRPRA